MARILFLPDLSFSPDTIRYIRELACNLDSGRFDPIVLLPGSKLDDTSAENFLGSNGQTVAWNDNKENSLLGNVAEIRRIVRRSDPDLIHLNFARAPDPEPLLAILGSGSPFALTLHSADPCHKPRILEKKLVRAVLKRSRVNLTVSSRIASVFSKQYGLPGGLFQIVPNGIETPATPQEEKSLLRVKRRILARKNDLILLCHAPLYRQKGQTVLLGAFARLLEIHPDVKLVVAGDGPDADLLNSLAASLGIAGRVFILEDPGPVSDFAGIAACFILPSLYDGLPFELFEAMASGMPVVASRVGGVGEVVEGGRSGWLLPPGDTGTLADALSTAISDPRRMRKMGAEARKRIRDSFPLTRMIEKTARAFDVCLRIS